MLVEANTGFAFIALRDVVSLRRNRLLGWQIHCEEEPPDNPHILVSIPDVGKGYDLPCSQPDNAYSSGDTSVQQGVLRLSSIPQQSLSSWHHTMLFRIVFDMEAFQLYELLEPKST